MEIEKVSDIEYKALEKENMYGNFQQTVSWAKLKESMGWKSHYFICRNEDDVYTWLILEKTYMRVFKIFYSQKGLAINYENEEVVKTVYMYMKDWIKQQNGVMLIVDPNLSYEPVCFQQLGIVQLKQIVSNVKDVGVNCYYVKELMNNYEDIFKGFSKRNKGSIKKSKHYVWEVNILDKQQIERFYNILKQTAERNCFSIRSLKYYEAMYDAFYENVVFIVLTMNVRKSMECFIKNIEECSEKLEYIKNNNKRVELFGQIKQSEKEIERLSKMNDYVDVCSAMYILDKPKELIHLFGGNVKEYMDFEGQFYLHDYMMQYAIKEGYVSYNFYGCENNGIFLEKIAYMKEGFGGKYINTIGDYLLVNDLWKVKWFYRCRAIYLWIKKHM